MSGSISLSRTALPLGFLRSVPDAWALVFGHAAMLTTGLLASGMQDANALRRALVLRDPGPKDVYHVTTYGIGGVLVAALLVYGLSWWLARRERVVDFRAAVASFCRLMWPGLLGLLVLLALLVDIEHKDLFSLLLMPVAALIVIFFAWRFFELRGGVPWRATKGDPAGAFRVWGMAVAGLAVLYVGWFSFLAVRQHLVINTGLHDLGIYEQMMWNTINGRPFECAMLRLEFVGYEIHKFNNHFFAEHFIPTYAITVPFYWLFPSAWTLLIMQTVLIAAAAVPAYLIAWRKLGSAPVAFLSVFMLLAHPLVQDATLDDVHVDTYAVVFLLGAYAACLYGRRILYWVLLLLALGCKQEMSINVALMGVFLLLSEKEHRNTALATIGVGIAWFVLTVHVIIPHYRDGLPLRQFERYGHFIPGFYVGSDIVPTPGLVLRHMLANPSGTLEIVFSPGRVRALLLLVAPFGLLMLFNRWVWLWVLPQAAIHLLSSQIEQYEFRAYYGITLVPAAFVGSVYGLRWLMTRGMQEVAERPRERTTAVTAGLLLVLILTWDGYGYTPVGGRFSPERFRQVPRERVMMEYLHAIPGDAVVTTQTRLGAQLAKRRYIYNIPEVVNDGDHPTEYVFLDTRGPTWPLYRDRPHYQDIVRGFIESDEWGLVLPNHDGLLLFKRGHPPEEHPVTFEELEFVRYRRGR